MLSLRNAFNDLLLLLYIEDADDAPVDIRYRLLNDLRAAAQLMQSCGEDYYGREPFTVSLTAGTSLYALTAGTSTLQTVLDPVWLTGEGAQLGPLRKLGTRAEMLSFSQLYLESLESAMENAPPLAWFVESVRNYPGAGAANNVGLNLYLLPPPDQNYTAQMQVIQEPYNFELADLCNTTVMIPVPHQYTESIFLPLARWNVTSCTWFTAVEKIPQLEKDYTRALALLGISDPRRPKPDGVGNDAAKLPQHRQQPEEQAA